MNLTGYFKVEDGDVLGPADIIAHKVRDTLAADQKLVDIFTVDRIETVDRFRNIDYRDYPRLQVCAFSEDQVAGTTNNDTNTTRLYVRIKYQDDGQWQTLHCGETESRAQTVGPNVQRVLTWPYGRASMATLEWHIFRVLKADEGLQTQYPNGTVADLTTLASFGPSSQGDDEPDPTNGRIFASNHTIQVTYQSNLIHSGTDAGKFKNAAANGG